jgi:hypothetical protein
VALKKERRQRWLRPWFEARTYATTGWVVVMHGQRPAAALALLGACGLHAFAFASLAELQIGSWVFPTRKILSLCTIFEGHYCYGKSREKVGKWHVWLLVCLQWFWAEIGSKQLLNLPNRAIQAIHMYIS